MLELQRTKTKPINNQSLNVGTQPGMHITGNRNKAKIQLNIVLIKRHLQRESTLARQIVSVVKFRDDAC